MTENKINDPKRNLQTSGEETLDIKRQKTESVAIKIDGKQIAKELRNRLKEDVIVLRESTANTPHLCVFLVGSRKDSQTYVRMKTKACKFVGIMSTQHDLPEDISQQKLIELVIQMNKDPTINGILIQLPLPKHMDEKVVLSHIAAHKDVDGLLQINNGDLYRNGVKASLIPCTPVGCIHLLDYYNVQIEGAHAIVIGRSALVGKPMAFLLLSRNATVTICHSRTKDIPNLVRQADIVVAAVGKPNFVKGSWLKPGAIVIDVGITAVNDASRKRGYRLVGDVEYEEAKKVASMITPVPGGVGPMTVAMLLSNTIKAFKLQHEKMESRSIDKIDSEVKTELKVNVRACGKSGLSLPVIGVGTWSWGGDAESYWGNQEQKDVNAVVDVALKVGCNFFDTAEAYNSGNSEIQLGKSLKDKFGDAIVGSKVLPANCTPTAIRSSLQGTLTRLGTDSIDLYMVHWPLNKSTMKDAYSETAVADCFKTLSELQSEGLIKHIGVSNFGVKQLTEALKTGVTIVVNQLVYNLLTRAIEFELMEFCASNGIGIIAYSPLMQGLLTNKFGSLSEVPDSRLRTRQFSGERNKSRHGEKGFEDLTWKTILHIRKIAADADIDMAALCIAWPLTNPNITCVIPGNRTKGQMENNAKAGTMVISEDIIAALNKATDELKQQMGPAIDIYESLKNQRSY